MKLESRDRKALRESITIPLAKLYFVFAGYVLYFGLTRILKPAEFGIYGVVMGLISVINGVIIAGALQGVSKFVSEDESRAEAVKKSAFILHGLLGGIIFICLLLFSKPVGKALNDESLSPYIMCASFSCLFYSFYAVFVGHLNGAKNFRLQGMLDMSYSTLKLLLVLSLAWAGFSVMGALGGFAGAGFIILLVSLVVVGYKGTAAAFPLKRLVSFELPIMAFVLTQDLLMHSDLFLIKALSQQQVANLNAGLYTACLSFARVPFLVVTSINYIVFPFISKAATTENGAQARGYIFQGVRITFIFSCLGCLLISSSPAHTLRLMYPPGYQEAAPALQILSIGYLFFSLFMNAITIINASGKPSVSLWTGVSVLIVQVAANRLLIPVWGTTGAARGTTLALLLGVIIAGIYVFRKYGVFIPLKNGARVLVVSSILYAVSLFFPLGGVALLLKDGILILLFGILLAATGELTRKELQAVWHLFSARASGLKKEKEPQSGP